MRSFNLLIFLLFSLKLYSQDFVNQNDSIKTDNEFKRIKNDSISFSLKSLKFEGSIYLSENLKLNHSFGSELGIIYNLGIIVSDKITLGLTTQDTKIDDNLRHINHFFGKYKFYGENKHKTYFSIKIPSVSFTKIENDQFKFTRYGLGHKIKFYKIKDYFLFIDVNYDFMVDWNDYSNYDSIFLLGISVSNKY